MIQECWVEIGADFIKNLVESRPRRCAAVTYARGGGQLIVRMDTREYILFNLESWSQ